MTTKNGKPVVRCSSLDQLIGCPGSRAINARLVALLAAALVELDDRASWEGQWCHDQAARRFVEKHGAMAPAGGLLPPRIPRDYKPDSFAEWIVDYYHRAVMEETPGDWAMEVECEMMYEFPRFWLAGHVDVNAVAPDASALQFDDLKAGANIVDAAECNWQVLGYAALFKLAYGERLRRMRGRIVQPRVKEGEGQRISAVHFTEKGIFNDAGELISEATIDTFVDGLERAVNGALDNPMLLNTGVKQCRWCPAGELLKCPAMEAEYEAMKMELTQAALDAITAAPDGNTLARWAVAKKLLGPKFDKAWDLLKEHALRHGGFTAENGVKVIVKDWSGAREFTPEGKEKVWEALCNDLAADRALACMNLSVPAIEKAYAAELKLPLETKVAGKDSGERQVENRFGALITRKTGKQLTILT